MPDLHLFGMDKEQIKNAILRAIRNNPVMDDIKSVSLFGSSAAGTAEQDSDIDLLIEFMPSATVGFFKFAQIQRNLQHFLGRDVDLLTPESLSKFFRAEVLKQAELVYEK